jgi:plasmid replication initiation protein
MLKLTELYTSYKLENILQMKSKYSIRIYEMLKCAQWKKHSSIMPIEELKYKMKITEKSYNKYTNFKARIIDKAQDELGKLTDLKFEYKELKKGRKIIALQFFISKNENWQKSDAGEIYAQRKIGDPEEYNEQDFYGPKDN